VTEFANANGVTQGAASQAIKALVEKRGIVESRTEGRSVYYRLTGETRVALEA
jgi:DNA-binding transcriptional ArsR family regulator